MSEIQPADLRNAVQQVEQIGFGGADPATLPGVADQFPAEAVLTDAWENKGDRYAVAAPTIERLADHMLEGQGINSRFRDADLTATGFTLDEVLLYSFRGPFMTAKDDEALDPLVRSGAARFTEIAAQQDDAPVTGRAILQGSDYPHEMSDHLTVVTELIRRHPVASALNRDGKIDVARQVLPRAIGRQASMLLDDFLSTETIAKLYHQGDVSLVQSPNGRWLMNVDGRMSASALRAEKEARAQELLEEQFRNAETIEIPVITDEIPHEPEQPAQPEKGWRKLFRNARSLGALMLRRSRTDVPADGVDLMDPPTIMDEPEVIVTLAEEQAPSEPEAIEQEDSMPALVCPAHHRRARGADTALERFIYAGINLAADLGVFDDDYTPHRRRPKFDGIDRQE